MLKIQRFGLLSMFLLSFISCGAASNADEISLSSSPPTGGATVGPSGGSIEIPGIAKVNFPAGAFSQDQAVSVREVEADTGNIDDYKRSISGAGNFSGKMLVITSPVQPKADPTVRYTAPETFLESLDPNSKPKLFAKFNQSGADGEGHDDYENIGSQFYGTTLTATLRHTAFTSGRPRSNGLSEAIIIMGSYSSNNNLEKNNQSFFLTSTTAPSTSCTGARYIGSPLERELEITSEFGQRIHPVTGENREHMGVDLRADAGDNVLATADGIIETISFNYDQQTRTGWGRYVTILHPNGSRTRYAHLEEGSTDALHIGEQVNRGEIIGKADTTGGVTGPHLHFEYERIENTNNSSFRIDPFPCIKLPIEILGASVGDALFHPYYGIPFEINVHIPEGNSIYYRECDIGGNTTELGYFCWASSPCSAADYSTEKIQGCLTFTEPRGTASATYRITDNFGNVDSVDISASWDCCDDPSTAHYFGISQACFTLGDNLNYCD